MTGSFRSRPLAPFCPVGIALGSVTSSVSATNAFILGGSAVLVLLVAIGTTFPSARGAALISPADVLKP